MKRENILQELLGIGLTLFSLFLLVSLFTFHSGDVGFLSAPVNGSTWNAGGRIGVTISFALLYSVGALAAWALAFLIGGWGISLVLRRSWPDLPYKVTGILLFLVALSIGEALAMGLSSSNLPHGGILGLFMTKVVLLAYLGETGSYLAVFYVALVSLLLATDFLFLETALEAVGRIRVGDTWVQRWQRRRAAMRQGRSERALRWELEDAKQRRENRHRRERLVEMMEAEGEEQALAALPVPARPDALAGPELLEDPPESTGMEPSDGDEALRFLEDPTEVIHGIALPVEAEVALVPDEEEAEEEVDPSPPGPSKEGGSEEDGPEEEEAADDADREPAPKTGTGKGRRKGKEAKGGYVLPPEDLLDPPGPPSHEEDRVNQVRCRVLEDTLSHFKISGRVVGVLRGPAITQFELSLAQGTKSRQLFSLQNDLALALKVEKVRIVAPLPGRGTIGVEVPNSFRETVVLKEVLHSPQYREEEKKKGIPLFLGKDAAGVPILDNLTEMPHLLIAGSTGSGKSICLNSILAGILLTRSPHDVKLVLIDPKRVEMTQYREIPHLLVPVQTDVKKAAAVLEGLCDMMDKRYAVFEQLRVRQITSFNRLERAKVVDALRAAGMDPDRTEHPMPYVVVVVDELSELMLRSSREVENAIIRLAQKSRAVGIHLILSTQRPSSDVITGLIKANMPARVAFQVTSMVESRVILDRNGAEKLLGSGDMLYLPPKVSHLIRAQGTFVSDEEVNRIVEWTLAQDPPVHGERPMIFKPDRAPMQEGGDEKLFEAGDVVLATGRASTTLLQRRLAVGYTRAARLVDLLEKVGLVGKFKGAHAREILMTFEEWEAFKEKHGAAVV
ncbi:MAG: FtsK/SpoIIIE family DNA translocase [Planctomycetota bacterium]|jgi:S-DNA-T family DNA segregation ATPase FtsK/SpoIIIE